MNGRISNIVFVLFYDCFSLAKPFVDDSNTTIVLAFLRKKKKEIFNFRIIIVLYILLPLCF